MRKTAASRLCRDQARPEACVSRLLGLGSAALGVIAVAALALGYHVGQREVQQSVDWQAARALAADLAAEREQIARAKAEQRAHLDAMALRIAELQAHLMRLDALGGRLVEVGELDREEFDFSVAPPAGGIDDALPNGDQSIADLTQQMQQLARRLEDRELKLETLEVQLMNRDVRAEVTPSGRPVTKGWLSSGFGKRTDPFTGKKSYHRGIDFAGKPGTEVIAVASGVVMRSERASGYGNVIEIRHADGYTTLYAHNKENLVYAGDVVSKGQTIALLGSTGRSSGPHVHFELHRNDKIVNPLRFIR
jgi:murein DD-endopeptidase MepM/ murein hydrolase activator NlpD